MCEFRIIAFPDSAHSVVVVRLRPVADQLESTDDLAYGEETNHLGDNNTHRVPLFAGHVSDLREDVGG